MRAWYFPSHNGDLRLEPIEKDMSRTRLTIVEPTPHEKQVLAAMEIIFRKKGWWTSPEPLYKEAKRAWLRRAQKVLVCELGAPFVEIGAVVVANMRPALGTLTAIRFESGKVFALDSQEAGLSDAMNAALTLGSALDDGTPYRAPAALPPAPAAPLALADKPKVAATVKRPTPCCPECIPGAVEPASEVLLSFLNEEQHESWARDRCIKVIGGYTGVEYLLAHRHTARARRIGRVCFSITDDAVVHFHQTEVPPEEEVLAAKLILEHREDWLRNEATMLEDTSVGIFKNPFGDGGDGTADAVFMNRFGNFLLGGRDGLARHEPISVSFRRNPATSRA